MLQNALYTGHVYHKRHKPFTHKFRFRVFSVLVNLDDLPNLSKSLKYFSFNRFGLISINNNDHGPRDGSDLKNWVIEIGKAKNIDLTEGQIFLLTFPRLWGYVFNPISIYFCYDRNQKLAALLYQVKNTFGEQHGYLIPTDEPDNKGIYKHSADKIFHVSPFIEMACRYDFTIKEPDEHLSFAIHQDFEDGRILTATWDGVRSDLTDSNILKAVIRHMFLTFKITAGIHWEALWIWLKGARYIRRPPLPEKDVS